MRAEDTGRMTSRMLLKLEDGTQSQGSAFGADTDVAGEVVFNTGMCGYVETLTDPSYRGQILVMTYPSIGNYGVPAERAHDTLDGPFESSQIQVQGLIVQAYSEPFSHHSAVRSLSEWLREQGVPAMTNVDTRSLTRHLRTHGTMSGHLLRSNNSPQAEEAAARVDMESEVYRLVAPDSARVYGEADKTVLLIDIGAKDNIVRSLLKRGVKVVRVPWFEDLTDYWEKADGIMIGNGPGDPAHLSDLTSQLNPLLEQHSKPVFGICLGNQVLARAVGADTFKLPYGHRGLNQPVQDLVSRKSFITSQNHGYAVDESTLPGDWEPWFVNINDGTNEGIRSRTKPYRCVQFHPEATPGPEDTAYLFDEFVNEL